MDSQPEPQDSLTDLSGKESPRPSATDTERAIAEIWSEVLEERQVGPEDNFFDLGGHSVLLHLVQDRITEELGRKPSLVDLFTYTTVRALARHLDGDTAGPARSGSAAERAGGRARLQQRARRTRSAARDQGGTGE
ncbi:phosphopantetheine-binding protein [Streptomyces sp. MMBL 11-3]|uniref:EsmB3 n=1 Tax=Streptomyces antibioticus TaxID=1890 RepID=H6ACZ2_STRAT|nr:EsmB3 [Streptomyces antibioticus]